MERFKTIFGFVMMWLYIGIGIFCITINGDRLITNKALFRLFGVLALVYGLFRAYRSFKEYKSFKKSEDESNNIS